MDKDKFGQFIKELRLEKGYSQNQLADMIPIGRQAISKWENGKTEPDSPVLMRLSEIFDVSINELFAGQRLTLDNEFEVNQASLAIYKDNSKKRKYLKVSLIVIVLLVLSFFIYYFITSYNSIKVYIVSAESSNIELYNGIFVSTRSRIYLKPGEVSQRDNREIEKATLYFLDKNNERNDLYYSDSLNLLIYDYIGYGAYFDYKDLKYVVNNLYIEVIYKDSEVENIKLDLRKSFVNNFKSYGKGDVNIAVADGKNRNDSNFEETIKKKFVKKDDHYLYEDNYYIYKYLEDSNYINAISKSNKNEEWYYDIQYHVLKYIISDDEFNVTNQFVYYEESDSIKCLIGNCDNSNKLIKKFYANLSLVLGKN